MCSSKRKISFKKGEKTHAQTNHVLARKTVRRQPNLLHNFGDFRSSGKINITLQLHYSICSLDIPTTDYIKTCGCPVLSVSFSLADFSEFNCGLQGHYYIFAPRHINYHTYVTYCSNFLSTLPPTHTRKKEPVN